MTQAVSRRPLSADTQVRARVIPCGTCGGQSSIGTGFPSRSSVFSCRYNSSVALHIIYITCGMNNRPVRGRSSERVSRIDMNDIDTDLSISKLYFLIV
jgi:hypothetical protein